MAAGEAPVRSMPRVLDPVVAVDPDRPALVIGDEVTTYAQLESAVRRVTTGLRAHGVAPGWRLALVDDASVLSAASLLAATRLGAACALMNPRLTAGELAELAAVAEVGPVGVAGAAYADTLGRAGDIEVLGGDELLGPGPGWPSGPEGDDQGAVEPGPEVEAVVLFTSGTTGTPKAVPFTHGLMGPRIAAFSPTVDPEPAVALMCVPLVHVGGMLGLLVQLGKGATSVVLTRFDAGAWLELVERHRVQTCFLVPTMLHRILEHPDFGRRDLSSLTSISYGAAPAPVDLVRRALEALPHVAFSNTFGQTETMGSITALVPGDYGTEKMASVGRPLPGVEVRVVDPVTTEPLPTGSVGELWVRTSASVIPDAQRADPSVPEGWLRTGDMVSVDEDGYLWPAGRLSDTINRGGEKFAPAEIEAVLREHPAVGDVAVIGVPDPEMGNRVGAAVVARQPVTEVELRDFCRGRIANFKLPERFLFVGEIPYNDFGKVSRTRLRELFTTAAPDSGDPG